MSHLPLEVLRRIFDGLETKKDLLQCQLTCKQWYNASVLYLYTTVAFQSREKTHQYAWTISKSPRLASYLKVIDTENLFTKIKYIPPNDVYSSLDDSYNRDSPPFNYMYSTEYRSSNRIDSTEYLLDVIIRQCPNVTKIKMTQPPAIFWQKLSEAAVRGQLSQLSKLIAPTVNDIEPYIQAAFSFRNSLQSLYIYEEGLYMNINTSRAVRFTMHQRIGEFIRLKCLDVFLFTNRQLNDLDGLIENCAYLEKINVNLCFAGAYPVEVEPDMPINPRPDIRIFKNKSPIIATSMIQLKYVMQKFTNLQYLEFDFYLHTQKVYYENDPTSIVLAQFLSYLMAITVCKVKLSVTRIRFIDAWDIFTSKTNQSKELIMKYFVASGGNQKRTAVEVEQDFIKVKFLIDKNSNVFPHVGFLLNSGKTIRSLTIEDLWVKHTYLYSEYLLYNALSCFDLLLDIFQLCPLLQKITLCSPKDMVLSKDLVYQHNELKSVHITQLKTDQYYKFLRHISFCLPNLKKLHLQYSDNYIEDKPTVIIVDIPNTFLDVFIWEYCFFEYKPMGSLPFLIKLKTNEDTKLYLFYNKRMALFDEKFFTYLLPNHLRIEIICEGLKEFRLVRPPFSHLF